MSEEEKKSVEEESVKALNVAVTDQGSEPEKKKEITGGGGGGGCCAIA